MLLKGALEGVVEDCISFVGIDLNSCSAAVLRYRVYLSFCYVVFSQLVLPYLYVGCSCALNLSSLI